MRGTFMRFTTEQHKGILDAEPRLRPCIVRPTYEEASAAAKDWCEVFAEALGIAEPEWIHHPPGVVPADPFDVVGSWGWRVE